VGARFLLRCTIWARVACPAPSAPHEQAHAIEALLKLLSVPASHLTCFCGVTEAHRALALTASAPDCGEQTGASHTRRAWRNGDCARRRSARATGAAAQAAAAPLTAMGARRSGDYTRREEAAGQAGPAAAAGCCRLQRRRGGAQ